MSDGLVLLIAAFVLAAIFFGLRWQGRGKGPTARPRFPKLDPSRNIVVDGSNVMHWGGEPSVLVLNRVLVALGEKGVNPIVYFDANVGYKLWGKHANAQFVGPKIGVIPERVVIAPSGTTADELLLPFAVENGLRVVSNDRFLDWRVQYPEAGEKGFLVKGEWKQGSVMLRRLRNLEKI